MSTMAGTDSTRNVNVVLTANVSPYQRAINDAGRATAGLATGVAKLGRSLDDLVKRAGRKMVLLGAGDLAALTAAAEASNRLDQALTSVRANSAITGQSVGALRREVMSLGQTIPDSTNNIARLVGQIQSLGIQGTQNIRNFTEMAERLAAATDTAPGQLLTGIVQMNREMGTGMATVGNYASALTELSKQNGVAAGDIMGFASSIQSVAQQAGYTQTQIMGLATAFTRAGADSAAAANVFVSLTSQINQSIVSNSAQLNQFASLVGMTRDQFKSLAQSHPEQAFTRVITAIQGQGQRGILTLQQLGLDGPRALRVIAALTSGQANMSQAMNQASGAYARNNAMTKASNSAWDDLSATMQKFRNEINQVVVQLGGPMAHVLNMFFEGLVAVFKPINTFLGMLGPIPGIVAGIGGAFLAVTGTITAFSIALLAAAGAWRALSGMTGTNTLQGLVSGMRAGQGVEPRAGARTIFRQRPIDMERRSGAAQRIFGAAYGVGQRVTAPPPEDPTLAQRVMARTGQLAGRAVTFPIRKVGWEAREALDTMGFPVMGRRGFDPRAIVDYQRRNAEAVNPMSVLGMFQGVQRGTTAIGRGVRGAGARMADLLPGGIGQRMAAQMRVQADIKPAEEKIARLRTEAAARVTMPVDARTFVRHGPGVARAVGEVGGEAESLVATAGRRTSMLGLAGRGIGAATGALSTFASAVSSVALPLGMLAAVGVPLYHVFESMHNAGRRAVENMDDLGAAAARTAGGTYTKPTGGGIGTATPADKVVPFGPNERGIALSGSFAASAGKDISQLGLVKGGQRRLAAQGLIQNMIANANSGQALTTSQQATVREELIAAYGQKDAQTIWSQLKPGGVNAAQAAAASAALFSGTTNDAGVFQNAFQGKGSGQRINLAVTPTANALNAGNFGAAGLGLVALQRTMPNLGVGGAGALLQEPPSKFSGFVGPAGRAGGARGRTTYGPHEDQIARFQEGIGDIVDQLNKGVKDSQKINLDKTKVFSIGDFVTQLEQGNQRAKGFAEELKHAGLNVNDLAASTRNLTTAMQHSATSVQAAAIQHTRIGGMASRFGINLANPQDVNYATNTAMLTQLSMVRGGPTQASGTGGQFTGFNAASMVDTQAIQRAIRAWTAYKQSLPGPNDPAFQGAVNMIDALNQKLMQQNSIFQTPQQMAGGIAQQANQMITQYGTAGTAGQQEQQYLDQAQNQIAQAEGQLKQYMLQVHQAHIDEQHELDDHNKQLGRMQRDFNLQQKEALYQRNLQITEATHEFNEQIRQMNFATAGAYGNPAQQVFSQYTQGADTAMVGMDRQVRMLQQSQSAMDQLHQMGLSRNAIRMLGLDDPKNVEQAQRYLTDFAQNPRLIGAFNKSISKRLKISNGIDTDINNAKFADMKRQFDYTAQRATDAFNHSQKLTNDAFNRSLRDFETDYQTSISRQQQSLQQIGEQVYTSFQELNSAAMSSGIANIRKFAASIVTQIGHVRRVESRFVNQALADLNQAGGGGGGGGGPSGQWGQIQGTPGGPGRMPGLHRATNAGVNTGFLLSSMSKPGTDMNTYGNPNLHWGVNIQNPPPTKQLSGNAKLAQKMAAGWNWGGGAEWAALYQIWNQESGFNTTAGRVDAAYGIPQADPGTKMATAGRDWMNNPATQIKWGLNYIYGAYGDPLGAWAHKSRTGWYKQGGVFDSPQVIGVGESGPEAVLPLNMQGATFVANVINATMGRLGFNRAQAAMTNTMPRASMVVNGNIHTTYDHSTSFDGNWTVMAQDPNEMARKLQAQRRLQALRRPIART